MTAFGAQSAQTEQVFTPFGHQRLRADVAEQRTPIIDPVWQATTRKAARTGLLGCDRLPDGQALAISTCSVHMLGMRFALDLVWLSRDGTVLRVDRAVPAGARMRTCLRARTCLELAAGQAQALGVQRGQALTFTPA